MDEGKFDVVDAGDEDVDGGAMLALLKVSCTTTTIMQFLTGVQPCLQVYITCNCYCVA